MSRLIRTFSTYVKPTRLSNEQITQAMKSLPQWKSTDKAITRTFKFPDFKSAFEFMTRSAARAELSNHHPLWTNCYDRVEVLLETHDCGGISEKDIEMAKEMDKLAEEQQGK